MPRRSTRIKHNEEQKDIDDHQVSQLKPKKSRKKKETAPPPKQKDTNNEPVTVSNDASDNENDDETTNMQIEQKDQSESISAASSVDPIVTTSVKRLSIDPNTALPPILASNDNHDIAMADIEEKDENEDDEDISAKRPKTLAQSRVRRSNRPTISYKDDSSSDDMQSSDSDDDNVLFTGLSKAERHKLREKMDGIQSSYSDAIRKERALKLEEIISSFEFNIGQKISDEEAAFIYDFCRKFQWDVNDKIEEEGDFFLTDMREMMDEKRKQVTAGVRCPKKKKSKKGDDSDSEFDLNEYDDSEDSAYSMDSDWEDPDLDNENMISDDDEFALGGRKKRKRNKNVWRDKDGKEYRAAGRLLLDDALKDTENFEGWSGARVQAWKNKTVNPNAYYYRFNDPGESQKNGRIAMDEHKVFMERVLECGVNVHWGSFSMKVPGRVGYQCSNYWRQMMKDKWVKDPNYWIRADGSFQFKRAKKGSIPDAVRKYSFVVVKDPSKTFEATHGFHPKRPTDKQLSKYLQQNVKDLSEREKKGKKGKKGKGRGGKKAEDESTNSKEEADEKDDGDEDDGDAEKDNNDKDKMEVDECTKSKKKKKSSKEKKKAKKKKKDGDNDGDDSSEGKKSKKKKDKKAKKDKKSKKKGKKSKKKSKKGKKNKNKKEECDGDGDVAMDEEGEGSEETTSKGTESGRDKKRKRNENGEASELEPPPKKRKITSKKSKTKEKEEEEESDGDVGNKENETPLSLVLGDMTDLMTGDKLSVPAISPYGHVMEYSSWCSILRNKRTKNKCPFTQQAVTRRSLVKLDENNIEEYKDKIVNITDDDIKHFKESS